MAARATSSPSLPAPASRRSWPCWSTRWPREPATAFTLVYGNRSPDSIMFRERLEDLKDRHLGRFTLLHVLSRNEE